MCWSCSCYNKRHKHFGFVPLLIASSCHCWQANSMTDKEKNNRDGGKFAKFFAYFPCHRVKPCITKYVTHVPTNFVLIWNYGAESERTVMKPTSMPGFDDTMEALWYCYHQHITSSHELPDKITIYSTRSMMEHYKCMLHVVAIAGSYDNLTEVSITKTHALTRALLGVNPCSSVLSSLLNV